ncbi:MAG: cyclic nucleotide-binding domain-containing protein [Deltaproteobacteria bacterium]|nr:cyclic nucleotide-binding domain-containing protein [Deltaproteobacteria bacterium]
MEDASLLATVPLFASLDPSQIAEIAAAARHEQYARADIIIREGDQDARLFVLVSGVVTVYKLWGDRRQRTLRQLGEGSWFGEMAPLVSRRRTATVVAETEVDLLSLNQLDILDVIRSHPDLSIGLLRTLAGRLEALEDHLVTTLGGFVPICASCKSIREEDGSWTRIEEYFSARSEVSFSHGLCPVCDRKLNPEFYTD